METTNIIQFRSISVVLPFTWLMPRRVKAAIEKGTPLVMVNVMPQQDAACESPRDKHIAVG